VTTLQARPESFPFAASDKKKKDLDLCVTRNKTQENDFAITPSLLDLSEFSEKFNVQVFWGVQIVIDCCSVFFFLNYL
jgi:hypothetical protein